MNKADLIDVLVEDGALTRKQAQQTLEQLLAAIKMAVAQGEKVTINNFGTFKSTHRKARTGRNPKTGARVSIPASRVPKFSPSGTFYALVGDNKA